MSHLKGEIARELNIPAADQQLAYDGQDFPCGDCTAIGDLPTTSLDIPVCVLPALCGRGWGAKSGKRKIHK